MQAPPLASGLRGGERARLWPKDRRTPATPQGVLLIDQQSLGAMPGAGNG